MEVKGALRYSNAAGSSNITAASPGSLANSYLASDGYFSGNTPTSPAGTVFIKMNGLPDRREIRAFLTLAGVDASPDDKTGREDIYLVVENKLDGETVTGYTLWKLGQAVYTFSTNAVLGGRTGHKYPKKVAWTSKGVSEAFGAGAALVQPLPASSSEAAAGPAGIGIYDIGPAIGILRVPALGASSGATSVAPLHQIWR